MKFARKTDEACGLRHGDPMSFNIVEVPQTSSSTEQWTSLSCVGDGDEKLVRVLDVVFLFRGLVCS